jgi:hypothetical protein
MAHEGYTVVMILLGFFLLLGYFLGPRKEVRRVKRLEAMVMLVPSGLLLIFLAMVVYSGIIG